jgi:predicted nucleotidyltransferase
MKHLPKNNCFVQTICKKIYNFMLNSETAAAAIDTVYVFGSVLDKKKFKHNSDIDLAFHVEPPLYKQDPFKSTTQAYLLSTQIGLSLDRKTDVVILNSASLETAFQVITTGVVAYESHVERRIEYELAVKGMYYDFKPFINTLRSNILTGLNP